MKRSLRSINFILMFVLCFGALGFTPRAVEAALPTDLFFSEYIEGSSYNKALEIYNGTGSPIDLAAGGYTIKQYSNGNTSASATINLTGTLANNDVYVVTQGNASDAIKNVADQIYGTTSLFNGDDALVLSKGATVLDVIGVIGTDPGAEWGTGLTSTADNTLVRKANICSGDPIGSDAFDPAVQWDGYAQDTFSSLGSHTSSCAPDDAAPTVSSTSPVDVAVKVALDSSITITFSEAVTLAADWYEIDCSISGLHTATVDETADPLIVLDPASDFVLGDVCEVTVFAAKVEDDDAIDPPGNLASNYVFSFSALKAPKINEYSQSTAGTDVEYVEIYGDPSTDYSAYKVLEIEGDWSTSNTYEGQIEEIIDIGTTDVNGFYLASLPANALENSSTSTLLLVKNFSGALNQDLDTDDNGALDVTPWDSIVDSVAYHDGGTSDLTYGIPVLGVAYDGLLYTPGGASRIPDGYDTESATDWVRNDFDLAGIPGFAGTISAGEAYNTPGAPNIVYIEAAPTVSTTAPANGLTAVPTDSNIQITFSEKVTVTEPWFTISCANSGAHTATVIDTDPIFTLDPAVNFLPNEVCTVTVLATGVNDDDTDDGTYDDMLANYVFSFTTGQACGDVYTHTYDIQGSGATSPLALGTIVAVEGVVVGDFTTGATVIGGKNGFYIQDPVGDANVNTSDGLFIDSNLRDVQVGDRVRVAGAVAEFVTGSSTLTQLSTVTQIWACSTGNVITPTVVSLPVTALTDWEKFESMLVTFTQPLFISEYFNYDYKGEIVLETERFMTFTAANEPDPAGFTAWNTDLQLNSITLDDGRHIDNPDPALHPNGAIFDMSNLFRGGGTLTNVTGILDYYSGSYRIQPTKGADYTDTNPRTAAPDVEPGELTVASFNVLNYFLDIDTGSSSWICGPSGDMECRGADSAEELTRQRAKILAAMAGIEADIFGLMEIQNDTGASTADLVAGLNDVFGADTYDYIDTGFIGTDAIKQAIIYKPSAVTPVGTYKILTSAIDPRFIDTRNRPALAQVFEDNITGETFVVAVNHLKSKGSACSGDPDLLDGASNCNITRKTAALALVDWLANPTYFAGIENILIIGDLNSYDKEDPIDMIKLGADDAADTADDYNDMLHEIRGENAYGYLFGAQIGYLDYALANKTLADYIVDVNFWHINADEPDIINYDMYYKLPAQDALYAPDAYKASDHDPVIITLTLNHAPVATPDAYQTDEDIAIQAVAPGVLANDTDVNPNDTLTVDLVTNVASGTLVLNANGSFLYTPALNFFGEVSFAYRVFDGKVYSNTVTVTITVLPVNDSPVAVDDLYETDQDVALVVPVPGVLDNDSDPDPSDMFTVVLMTPTQSGTVVLQADGSFTYTPAPGFSGTDTFTYALISLVRGGYADTATVTITVHPVYRYYLPLIVK